MPNYATCIHYGPDCLETEMCKECYFITDENGIRTKPNHKHHVKQYFHKVTKFSKQQKIAICKDSGSLSVLARKYKCSTTTIYNIRRMCDLYVK